MKLHTSFIALLAGGALVSSASAQVMTEVRVSTAGADEEYVEILGTPGSSTDGLMVLAVEGDDATAGELGFLDKVYDLAGNSFPMGDEYFVFGSTEADARFPGEIDFIPGAVSNLFENSTQTIYLLNVPDPMDRVNIESNLMGTDIRTAPGAMTTILSTLPGVTVLDSVSIRDDDPTDVAFDGAPDIGPDGTFLPSGAVRDGGCPGDWCTDVYVNFGTDGVTDPGFADPTPGAVNPTTGCMTTPGTGTCPGGGSLGMGYCMTNPNSTGASGSLTAFGSILASNNDVTLNAASLPAGQFGIFVTSAVSGFVPNPNGSNGNLCLGGSIGRYVGPGQIMQINGAGEMSLVLNLAATPSGAGTIAVMAGDTRFWQAWHRDGVGGGSNFTNGLEITFQ